MSESIDTAKEAIEGAQEAEEKQRDGSARNVAVLIAALAAALALAEMGEKGAQNDYLTHHIQASDDWNFYQAKTIRSNVYSVEADTLESQPTAADPAVRKRIDAARAQAKRLDDDEKTLGRKQLMEKARESEELRDHAFHRFHLFELVVGALEISIVLASVSVVTRVRPLALGAVVLGGGASLFGLAEALNLF
jgi:DNA polymerase III epsilon subunit-like protein